MLVGDFNVARYSDKKVRGRPLSIQQLQDLNDFIGFCDLTDIKHIGGKWSWHSNSSGAKRIVGRLDRVLYNNWIQLLHGSYYEYLSPIFMHPVEKHQLWKIPFKFYHYWLKCHGFHDIVKKAWEASFTGFPLYKTSLQVKSNKKGH